MLQIRIMSTALLRPGTSDGFDPYHQRPMSGSFLISTLESIPGSAAPTPAARDSPGPAPIEKGTDDEVDSSKLGDAMKDVTISRNSSVVDHMPGSYFAQAPVDPLSQSGLTTLGGRIRPAIEIPAHTADQPLFSSYPHQTPYNQPQHPLRNSKTRRSFSLKPTFALTPHRRQGDHRDGSASDDGGDQASDDDVKWTGGRRRSWSLTHHEASEPASPSRSPKSIFRRDRAGSLGARHASEYHVENDESWRQMARAESDRLRSPMEEPFSYQQPTDSGYTLQSVSTVATVRPLASPNYSISPRKSSLVESDQHIPISEGPGSPTVVPQTATIPHGPPPRRSSLDMTAMVKDKDLELDNTPAQADVRSVLSSSITCTDTSIFSPSSSSQEHPLSSATTSLSRSAKSAKEGSDERDAALVAVKLQRSLEWEAKQTKRRRRLDKRTMVVLELVETEVAYAEGLRALVQVYLPQLAALPSVSERTASLIARNAVDLLDFHANFATTMVDVLKEEKIGYDILHEPDVPIERVARRLAGLFVEHVSLSTSTQKSRPCLCLRLSGEHVPQLSAILCWIDRRSYPCATRIHASRLRHV